MSSTPDPALDKLEALLETFSDQARSHLKKLIWGYHNMQAAFDAEILQLQTAAKGKQATLKRAADALAVAAEAYRPLLTASFTMLMLNPTPDNPNELVALPNLLEKEAKRLAEQYEKLQPKTVRKRWGENVVYLIAIEEFIRAWNGRSFTPSQLADLMGTEKYLDQDNIRKQIQRFRSNPDNSNLCKIIEARQREKCDRIRAGRPIEMPI